MKITTRLVPFLTIFILLVNNSFGQWLDKQSLQATVLIEKIDSTGNFIPHGTGFLMYNYDKNSSDLIVVTCAHLLKGKSEICVRVNPDTSIVGKLSFGKHQGALVENAIITNNTIRFIVDLKKNPLSIHPQKDVAAFFFSVPALYAQKDTIRKLLKLVDLLSIPESGIRFKKDLSLGDEIYFIGFPLGYGISQFVEPIIRSGSIAWLPKEEQYFLLDAFSFGGNSGSPVFLKQIIGSKVGELSWTGALLVGMVVGHQSITIDNVLNQPNPKELKFEVTDLDLNIGLARCVYVDDIIYTIDQLQKK